jgi:hypothetical protein
VALPTGLKAVAGGREHDFSMFVCRNAVLHKCPAEFRKIVPVLFCRLADGRTLFPPLVAHLTQQGRV